MEGPLPGPVAKPAVPPPQPIPPIPEEQEPYANVATEHLLVHLERVVKEACQQLNLIVQALHRRPLASWERRRIETALTQMQETLTRLQAGEEPLNQE